MHSETVTIKHVQKKLSNNLSGSVDGDVRLAIAPLRLEVVGDKAGVVGLQSAAPGKVQKN